MLTTDNESKNKNKKIFRLKSIVKLQKRYTEKEVKNFKETRNLFLVSPM